MGRRNYLVEGVSGVGKTSAYRELQRRGLDAVNGDRERAYAGDPKTGEPVDKLGHEYHIWDMVKVRAIVADQRAEMTFFCGGSRNFSTFIDLFDGVFLLEVDPDTLDLRLAERPETEWGGRPAEREFIARLRRTREDIPADGVLIDATAPIERVVDEILRHAAQS